MKPKIPTATVNLTPDVARDMDKVVEQYTPFVRRHAVHAVALRLGLDELRKDPGKLVAMLREKTVA